jgi:RNA binding exosome subunit
MLLKNVLDRLEKEDRILLSSSFGDHVDSKGSIYLRLSKQEAFLGKVRLCSVDSIHIKARLSFIPAMLEELESSLESVIAP